MNIIVLANGKTSTRNHLVVSCISLQTKVRGIEDEFCLSSRRKV